MRNKSENIVEYLKVNAERHGDCRSALVMPVKGGHLQISFGQLWGRVNQVAAGLRGNGILPGDRIIVMVPMSIELYAVLLGIIQVGAVAVFVDPWIGARQVAAFSAFAEPRGYIGVAKAHLLRLLNPRLRRISLTVTTGRAAFGIPARTALADWFRLPPDTLIHPAASEEPALITFTSGSSGTPKGANRTHGFLNAQYQALKQEFPVEDTDVDMPMFPVFALANIGNGITTVIPDMDFKTVARVRPAAIIRQLRQFQVTTITASPPFFDRLAHHLDNSRQSLLPFRRFLTGGAPVEDRQLRDWRRVFPDTAVEVVYGSTEAEPVAHISLEERLRASADKNGCRGYCAGKPTSLVRTRVIRLDRQPVLCGGGALQALDAGPGETGELIVAGRHVCRDYFNNAEAVRENKIVDADGTVWHRMGDTGYFDAQGRFWLVGRVHSTIWHKTGPVHPQLLEQSVCRADERIAQTAALGMPREDGTEDVIVIVRLQQHATAAAAQAVSAAVARQLAGDGLPPDCHVIISKKAFPMDPRHNSKIDYQLLKRMTVKENNNDYGKH